MVFLKDVPRKDYMFLNIGLSPSGKAQDFDSCIALVRIQLAQLSCCTRRRAQTQVNKSAVHLGSCSWVGGIFAVICLFVSVSCYPFADCKDKNLISTIYNRNFDECL